MQVEEGGLELFDEVAPRVEEPGATWTAQVLAPGGRKEVASDLLDVDRHLTDGLARVEEVENAGLSESRRRSLLRG